MVCSYNCLSHLQRYHIRLLDKFPSPYQCSFCDQAFRNCHSNDLEASLQLSLERYLVSLHDLDDRNSPLRNQLYSQQGVPHLPLLFSKGLRLFQGLKQAPLENVHVLQAPRTSYYSKVLQNELQLDLLVLRKPHR